MALVASTTAAAISSSITSLLSSYSMSLTLAKNLIAQLNIADQLAAERAASTDTSTAANSTALCGPSYKGNKKSSIPAANGSTYTLGSEWGSNGATQNIGIECPTCGHKYCGCKFHGGAAVKRSCGCSYTCNCSCCDCCNDSTTDDEDDSSDDITIELPLTDEEIEALVTDEDEEVEINTYSNYDKYRSELNVDISGFTIALNLSVANIIDAAFQAATTSLPNVSLLIAAGTLSFSYSSNSAIYAANIASAVTAYFAMCILPIGTPVSGVITSVTNTASAILSPLFTQLYNLFTNGPSDPYADNPIEEFVEVIFNCVTSYLTWIVIETQGTSVTTYTVTIS